MASQGEERLGQADQPLDREQEEDAHPHGQHQSDLPRARLQFLRESTGQDREEHDVVDAQDDFEAGQGEEGDQILDGKELVHFVWAPAVISKIDGAGRIIGGEVLRKSDLLAKMSSPPAGL